MNNLNPNPQGQPTGQILKKIKWKVLKRRFRAIHQILTESTGNSDTAFRVVLNRVHGIPSNALDQDPYLYAIYSTEEKDYLFSMGVHTPTLLQIYGACRIFDLDEDRAVRRFKRLVGYTEES